MLEREATGMSLNCWSSVALQESAWMYLPKAEYSHVPSPAIPTPRYVFKKHIMYVCTWNIMEYVHSEFIHSSCLLEKQPTY